MLDVILLVLAIATFVLAAFLASMTFFVGSIALFVAASLGVISILLLVAGLLIGDGAELEPPAAPLAPLALLAERELDALPEPVVA